MKKIILCVMAVVMMVACQSDDTDFSAYTEEKPAQSTDCTIYIAYNGNSVTVTGDDKGLVTANGAHVTVNATSHADSLLLVLSGNSDNGSLLVYRQKKFGIQLNGVTLNNTTGPAINNQCKKTLYLYANSGTANTLNDGTSYTDITNAGGQTISQKGTLFS